MHTIVVTIGRNVGNVPMPSENWESFKKSVAVALLDHQATLIQRPNFVAERGGQIGMWEGQQEDAATFVAFAPQASVAPLRNKLADLAYGYEQEAIGFIAVPGTEHLVFPSM